MYTSVGQKLRQAREEQGHTLDDVAEVTHIRLHYLQAMEVGDFDALPSPVQKRGFLRAYAGFLGLDSKPLLEALERGPEPVFSPLVEETPAVQEPPAVPQEDEITPGKAEAKFAEIGGKLRAQREILGLSHEDVERHTHLRTHYLQALEAGNLKGLPSPVQGRGMLNNYAKFLGLDPEPLLLLFADGLQTRLAATHPERFEARPQQRRVRKPAGPVRRLFSRDFLLGSILVISLVVFAVWGVLQILSLRSARSSVPTPPSFAEVLLPSPSATEAATPTPTPNGGGTSIPAAGQPLPAEATQVNLTPEGQGPIQVQIIVRQRAWVRVTVDGEIALEGRVLPGSAYAYAGEEQVEILTGNGAGLQVIFNQQDLGALGLLGQVVQRIFTEDGLLTPTPSITPTPMDTPSASPTSTPGP
jgi:cytoskeletal protein RodZ